MNNFNKLLINFRELKLPDGEYAIYGSGPMGIRGIRDVHDLDVIVTDKLYRELKEKYPKDPEKEKIMIGDIEIYPIWFWPKFEDLESSIMRAELIDDLRFVQLEDLLKWKEKMGRPKDFEDVKLINNYLNKQNLR